MPPWQIRSVAGQNAPLRQGRQVALGVLEIALLPPILSCRRLSGVLRVSKRMFCCFVFTRLRVLHRIRSSILRKPDHALRV